MTDHDYTVVDADAHYVEHIDDLVSYLEDPWKTRVAAEHADTGAILPGASTGYRFVSGRIQRRAVSYPEEDMTPEQVPRIMNRVGVDAALIFPNTMLSFSALRGDDGRMVALANAYIDFMLDRVIDPDAGIYAQVVAPYDDPPAAAELIDRVGDEPGVVGVCLVTSGPEPPLGNRRYDPIYEAAEDNGLPLVYHTGGWVGISDFPIKGYEKMLETHTLGFLWSNLAQITSVTVQGVPVKFPDLDIVFMESGVFYVPMIMQRLDAEYMKRQSEAPLLDRRPSTYMQEYYYGTQPIEVPDDPSFLEQIVAMIGGVDRLVFATDYPHWDYDEPSAITDLPVFTEAEKQRILAGTAEEVFGI